MGWATFCATFSQTHLVTLRHYVTPYVTRKATFSKCKRASTSSSSERERGFLKGLVSDLALNLKMVKADGKDLYVARTAFNRFIWDGFNKFFNSKKLFPACFRIGIIVKEVITLLEMGKNVRNF
jgi:hypothetical protein